MNLARLAQLKVDGKFVALPGNTSSRVQHQTELSRIGGAHVTWAAACVAKCVRRSVFMKGFSSCKKARLH
jgi:hypothetical protein